MSATADQIIRSILNGEIRRAGGVTKATAETIAKRCLRKTTESERDDIALSAFFEAAHSEAQIRELVDEREPSHSVRAISAGLPGGGRRRI